MKKIIIAPDSFKGSITSAEFCQIADSVIKQKFPSAETVLLPIADGGEGTADCIYGVTGGKLLPVRVKNALGGEIAVEVLFIKGGKTAIIEMAKCAGLPGVKGRENPEITSTYGVGQMVEFAVEKGASEVIFALGGSCTNDCGAGMLSCLGVEFFDREGKQFVPVGKTLSRVERIGFSEKFTRYGKINFKAMCDVVNPLCGDAGCSRVFARQKGADDGMIERLEKNVRHFSDRCSEFLKCDNSSYPGAGAAGGLGFACKAFLNGELISGIKTLLSFYDFDGRKRGADLIITGEGCFDGQSLMGKAVGGIIAQSGNIPVAVMCGKYKQFDHSAHKNLTVICISGEQDLNAALKNAKPNLKQAIEKLLKS